MALRHRRSVACLSRFFLSPDFAAFWAGQTVSGFGSYLTASAIGFLAILTLHASPVQVSVLAAMGILPFIVATPLAGILVNRMPRRTIMLIADSGRAGVLLIVPIAVWHGQLRIEIVVAVLFVTQGLGAFFTIAYQSYVPSLVQEEQLLTGNARLASSSAIAESGGPALAGMLMQVLGGAGMMLLDVCSFLVSLGSLALIQTRETPLPAKAHASAWHELFDGWRIIHAHPVLRQLVFADMLGAMGGGFFTALYGIYVLRDLSMSPAIYDY